MPALLDASSAASDVYKRQPQNLVQAMRDCFGSHTYQRVDKEGTFHTEWLS